MRLLYSKYNIEFELLENQINVCIIEQEQIYAEVLNALYIQTEGAEGDFVFSEGSKLLKISKELTLIVNPFSIDFNEKKVLTHLYQELTNIALEEYTEQSMKLNRQIIDYLDSLIQNVPYPLAYDLDLDITAILKDYHVKIETTVESFLEKLTIYMRILHQICKLKIFVFANLKLYLSDCELQKLYEFAFYEKLHLILLEGNQKPKLEYEKTIILDHDLCRIDIN